VQAEREQKAALKKQQEEEQTGEQRAIEMRSPITLSALAAFSPAAGRALM
jgi:hypothetical protein